MKSKHVYFILFLLLFFAGLVRLYRFDSPVADWHSWRQADTSAVSRNFVKHGFDLLHPRFDDLSNVPSGKDNPQGYRFVEFPLYNVLQASAFMLFGVFSLEQWGRIVTILSSLLSVVFVFLIVRKHAGEVAGLLSAFFFGFLPFNIYYGRTILPDTMMVMARFVGIYFFSQWIAESEKRRPEADRPLDEKAKSEKPQSNMQNIFFFVSLFFSASALLLKPYAVFFMLPMVVQGYTNLGFGMVRKWQLWLFAIISLLPLILWRIWMAQFPEGIPANAWLFNGGNIRFKGSFFYWLFAERLSKIILGYFGTAILVIGVLTVFAKNHEEKLRKSSTLYLCSFIFASLLYLTVFARGNIQHDYYQILIIPTIAIFLGIGGSYLVSQAREHFSLYASRSIFVVCTTFLFLFSWYHVRDYFNINNGVIVEAGKAVDQNTPQNAKVLAPYNGDTTLLYHTNRQGWASYQHSLEEMIAIGADFLIIVDPAESDRQIAKRFVTVTSTEQYVLLDLSKPL